MIPWNFHTFLITGFRTLANKISIRKLYSQLDLYNSLHFKLCFSIAKQIIHDDILGKVKVKMNDKCVLLMQCKNTDVPKFKQVYLAQL